MYWVLGSIDCCGVVLKPPIESSVFDRSGCSGLVSGFQPCCALGKENDGEPELDMVGMGAGMLGGMVVGERGSAIVQLNVFDLFAKPMSRLTPSALCFGAVLFWAAKLRLALLLYT